jgi:hypothetical protein
MILQCLVGAEGKGRTHGRLTLRLLTGEYTAASADYLMVFTATISHAGHLFSAARNLPHQENAATHKAHRRPPSCRGRGRCKTNLRPAFRRSVRLSSGRRRNRTQPGRHVPPRIKSRLSPLPRAPTISNPVRSSRARSSSIRSRRSRIFLFRMCAPRPAAQNA